MSTNETGLPPITLSNLSPAEGSTRPRLRVGRGRASGAGKTCNRGHNGEGQRSGNSTKRGFEGGQMPGYRQMPKRNGFQLINRRKWLELNIGDVDALLTEEETALTYEMLAEWGLLRRGMDGVRILGSGEISRKVTVQAHYVTGSAREKLEAAGGKVELFTAAVAD
jgi:large subunit ribosomal protein L15